MHFKSGQGLSLVVCMYVHAVCEWEEYIATIGNY